MLVPSKSHVVATSLVSIILRVLFYFLQINFVSMWFKFNFSNYFLTKSRGNNDGKDL